MRRILFALLIPFFFLISAELGVRALYQLAHSQLYLAYFLEVYRSHKISFETEDQLFTGPGFFPPHAGTVWASGLESELFWPVLWPKDRTLAITIRSFPHPLAEAAPLSVYLNDQRIGGASLSVNWSTLHLQVPAALQRRGQNILRFSIARLYPASLLDEASVDPRMFGFQIDLLEIRE